MLLVQSVVNGFGTEALAGIEWGGNIHVSPENTAAAREATINDEEHNFFSDAVCLKKLLNEGE